MLKALTETAITASAKQAALTGKRIELVDATQSGLRLRITHNGGKTWALAMRDGQGRMRRFGLGAHPAMSISAAREAARLMWSQVKTGSDPVQEARQKRAVARAAKEGIGTLDALLKLYERKVGVTQKSWPESKRRIEVVFKPFLRRPLGMLRPRDFQLQADAWESSQSAAAAIRYIRPILKWASVPGRGYVARDLADLTPPATITRRDRVLNRDELARLLPTLIQSNGVYALCMRFLLLTLARRSEASKARWSDVDLEVQTWTIPAPKNDNRHIVPLSHQALALLESIRPKRLDQNAMIFTTAAHTELANWDRETKKIMKMSGTAAWTRHDLRRTGATMLGEMGELPDFIEAALNHTSIHSRLAATYNQARYRPQVAAALQRLADALDGIEAGGAKIMPLKRG